MKLKLKMGFPLFTAVLSGCGGKKVKPSVVQKPLEVNLFQLLPVPTHKGGGKARHRSSSVTERKADLWALAIVAMSWMKSRIRLRMVHGNIALNRKDLFHILGICQAQALL